MVSIVKTLPENRNTPPRPKHQPLLVYPPGLPILEGRDDIVDAIHRHQVVVITGETGSGKTTQIPKMCLEAGRGTKGIIGCTQPRRIAAVSIARRIAEEMGEEPGKSVGYKIRFEDRTGLGTRIKIMTDGILLMEARSDPLLRRYDTLIIDEAHERSVTIDLILGILKRIITQRRDLKVIITSATIDPERFSRAFDRAPMIEVSGRTFPVEVRYRPLDPADLDEGGDDFIEAALKAVDELKRAGLRGHILIFMPTEQDIRDTCETLSGRDYRNTRVMPLYARLPSESQQHIFQSTREDKIIVATNVAETSITVPGIRYVIDTGLARIAEYRPQTRTKSLPVKAISQSSAIQRKGRCGRVESGVCIRLYSEEDYENRPRNTPPEILRTNLAEVILRMMHQKLGHISVFPFIDPPGPRAVRDGYDILLELGAIEPRGSDYLLTERGTHMARLPLDPRIARIILDARDQGCLEEALVIAAALSVQDPRERPQDRERQADEALKPFINPSSDFITLLNIWHAFRDDSRAGATENRKRAWCRDHFLSYRRMREWRSVQEELKAILNESELGTQKRKRRPTGEELYEALHRSILAGYISQFAMKKQKNIYHFARGREAMIFPGSGCYNRGGSWIVSAEMVKTSRLFARINASVKSEWLEEAGADFCRKTWSEPGYDADRGEVTAREQVTLFGLPIVSGRTISFGRVNPEEATDIFIREALVEEALSPVLPFLKHNRACIDRVLTMENKIRKRTLLVDEEDLVDFYRRRLCDVSDARTLKKMIRERGSDEFLRMDEEDVRRRLPPEELADYPDQVSLDGRRFSLAYHFDPGSENDGVTLKIPVRHIGVVGDGSPDWKIPGLLREKIAVLIRGLPKEYRRRLIPLAGTVDAVVKDTAGRDEGSLVQVLADSIQRRYGVAIPATAWPVDKLPEHLKIRYALTGPGNRELKASRDVAELAGEIATETFEGLFEKERRAWERSAVTRWDIGDVPERVEYGDRHRRECAFPALSEGEGGIHLRLFHVEEEATRAHRQGVRGLYKLQFAKDFKYLMQCLALPDSTGKLTVPMGGSRLITRMLAERVLDELLDGTARTEKAFLDEAAAVRRGIHEASTRLLSLTEPVLGLYGTTRLRLADLAALNGTNTRAVTFIDRLRNHLDRLVPPDFARRYDTDRLVRLPFYIRGLAMRADRGIIHLDKDEAKARNLAAFIAALEEIRVTLPAFSSPEKQRALEEFSWMLEEYALSLFAPEVKRAAPVSSKRLQRHLETLHAMI